ncbi:hypothetical protein O6H91_23G003300 [Diphasiastrum complanatum]|nr:hypothetical protein O6H91_23G003300 [Diphasiastrum complanatum]
MLGLGIPAKKHAADARPSTGTSTIGYGNADSRRPVITVEVQTKNEDKEVARQLAASALAAAKAAATVSKDVKPAGANTGGQPETLNFLDPSRVSETNKRKAQMQASASSGLDALLEQIGKKQKGNILDKSRKDWGEFKEEKGFEEELEAYKKSGDKYLDKVAFLQRADLREYEKERDARLAYQAKRRLETPSFTET